MLRRLPLGILLGLALPWALAACNATSSSPVVSASAGSTPAAAPREIAMADQPAPAVPPKAAPKAIAPQLTLAGVKPAQSDALLLYYPNDPDTVNVITGNDTTGEAFQRWVYETLADRKFSNPDEFEPALAESWKFDEKNLEFTINLRRGVKWHPMTLPNGTPLPRKEFTARDVKFTFDCILNTNIDAASLRSYYEDPDAKEESQRFKIKVKVVDDYTIKVKWTKPYFLAKEFTLGIPVIPRHVYSMDEKGQPISLDFSSKEFAEGFNNHWANRLMCGTGPMLLKEWLKENRLVLVRNPDYWGPPFYFDRVVFRNVPNTNTSIEELLQNEIDWGAIAEKDRFLQSEKHPNVLNGKVKLIKFDYPGYRYIGYNVKREFFKDRRVRTALSHAIPVQKIIDEVLKKLASRINGPFLPGSTANDGSLPFIEYDLDKAAALLDEAGWTDTDGDGIRDKKVNDALVSAKFDLAIYADSPMYLTIAEIVKENCRKIGVEVQISPTKWALMLQKLRKKEFDAAMLGWALSWRMDMYQIWHGSQADLPESSNAIGYQNPELDKLIEEVRVTMDEGKQTELYRKMHKVIYDDQPYTFLFQDMATAAKHARLQNLKFYKIRPGYDAREWTASTPRVLGK